MQENPCRYNSCPCKVAKRPKKKTNLLVFASYHSNSLWQIFMTLPWLINKSGRDNQVWITNYVDGAVSNIKNHSSFFCYAYVAVPPRTIIWLNNTDWHLDMTLAPSLSNGRINSGKLQLQHTHCNPTNTGKVQIAFHKISLLWNNTVERKRFQRKAANFLFLSFCLFLYVSGGKKVVWAAHTSLFWPSRYAF